jgi:hypothetical protein
MQKHLYNSLTKKKLTKTQSYEESWRTIGGIPSGWQVCFGFFFFVLVLFVLNDGSVINKNLSLLFQGSDREEAVKKTTGDI